MIALYIRCAAAEDASHTRQKDVCTEYARTQFPGRETTLFEDIGKGGHTIDRRPGLRSILRLAENGALQALVCEDQDRLSRNMRDATFLRDFFQRHNVEVHFVLDGHQQT